jgi:hypothetical protein
MKKAIALIAVALALEGAFILQIAAAPGAATGSVQATDLVQLPAARPARPS